MIPLNIKGNRINIINTHLPFKTDLKYFISNFNEILKEIHPLDTSIVCGDLNSRSLILEDCYKKDVKYECSTKECLVMRQLTKLHRKSLEGTIDLPREVTKIKLNNTQVCGVTDKLIRSSTDQSMFYKFLKSMIDKDFLLLFIESNTSDDKAFNEFMNISNNVKTSNDLITLRRKMKIFREAKITYYPTYKRDIKTGMFSLLSIGSFAGASRRNNYVLVNFV